MRVLLVAPFFFLGNLSHAAIARDPARVQKEFDQAIALMGPNPAAAAALFGELYQETLAPRIQLEWARSLYLAGRLAEAKEQFIDVINKEIPITVRDKIEWYLSEIQKDNPLNFMLAFIRTPIRDISPALEQLVFLGKHCPINLQSIPIQKQG